MQTSMNIISSWENSNTFPNYFVLFQRIKYDTRKHKTVVKVIKEVHTLNPIITRGQLYKKVIKVNYD